MADTSASPGQQYARGQQAYGDPTLDGQVVQRGEPYKSQGGYQQLDLGEGKEEEHSQYPQPGPPNPL